MKKSVIAVAAAALFAALPLSSCGVWDDFSQWEKDHCRHRWEERVEEATCTSSGRKYKLCTKCYAVEDSEFIPQIPHEYEGGFTPAGTGCREYLSIMRCKHGCDKSMRIWYGLLDEHKHNWDYDNEIIEEDEHGCLISTVKCKDCADETLTRHMWDKAAIDWYNSNDGGSGLYSEKCPQCNRYITINYMRWTGLSNVLREPQNAEETALVGFASSNIKNGNTPGAIVEFTYEEYRNYLTGNYFLPPVLHRYI